MSDDQKGVNGLSFSVGTELKAITFSVQTGLPEEVEFWRALVSTMFELHLDNPSNLRGTSTTVFLGRLALSMTHTTGGLLKRTERTIIQSGLDNIMVIQYHSGQHKFACDTVSHDLKPGDFLFFDCAKTGEIFIEENRNSNLIFAREAFAARVEDIEAVHGQVLRSTDPLNGVLSAYLEKLSEDVGKMSVSDAERVAEATTSLFASSITGTITKHPRSKPIGNKNSLAAIRDFIQTHLHQKNLGPDMILDRFPVSRSSLYKMFEPLGGVQSYIRKQRLKKTLNALVSRRETDIKIGEIATECGFSSISSFNRQFFENFGITPSVARTTALLNTPSHRNLIAENGVYATLMESLASKAVEIKYPQAES